MRLPHVDKKESTRWLIFANALANALASCVFVIHFATSRLFSFVFFLKTPLKMRQPASLEIHEARSGDQLLEIGWLPSVLISCVSHRSLESNVFAQF